jgi:membrane peptidoglycan carboxypeptidase
VTIIRKLRAQLVIRQVAQQQGISTAQCRAAMAEAIRDAWDTGDPVIRQRQIELVGEGRVPTPEEFIVLVSGIL